MIQVENITKKYGSFTAVNDISFEIEEGEIVGFLGPNGAGKSTTMNMITGFIEPTSGKIIVDGYNISKKPKKAKRQIGYMPEGVPLYTDLTVKEFVTYMAELKGVPKKERKEKVEKALEDTGLIDVKNKLTRNLSRGYKQRVSMAGALVSNPKVIILDEPTVGLDPKQVTEIRALIKNLGKEHTVILSSHILSEVSQICNRVIIINKGKIIAIDTPENLEKKVQLAQAELINYRKRKDEETSNMLKFANMDLILDLLPVIDNFERALAVTTDASFDKYNEGYKLIYNHILDTLKKFGVCEIEALDKEFDPSLHEAVMIGKEEDKPNDVVLEVFSKGYTLKGRVIRPSKVKVNNID